MPPAEPPNPSPRPKQFAISPVGFLLLTIAAIVAVPVFLLMNLRKMLSRIGLGRMPARVSDLKFPVIVLQSDHSAAYVETNTDGLQKIPAGSSRYPSAGTTIIDSDFKIYTEQNVRAKRVNDFVTIFRILVPGEGPRKYTFDLKRVRPDGLIAARDRIIQCGSFGGTGADVDQFRAKLARQTTMAGLIEMLQGNVRGPLLQA